MADRLVVTATWELGAWSGPLQTLAEFFTALSDLRLTINGGVSSMPVKSVTVERKITS